MLHSSRKTLHPNRSTVREKPVQIVQRNGKIKNMDREAFEKQTKFFIETQIVPAMDELNATMPLSSWSA
jgi:hypothetical protein